MNVLNGIFGARARLLQPIERRSDDLPVPFPIDESDYRDAYCRGWDGCKQHYRSDLAARRAGWSEPCRPEGSGRQSAYGVGA